MSNSTKRHRRQRSLAFLEIPLREDINAKFIQLQQANENGNGIITAKISDLCNILSSDCVVSFNLNDFHKIDEDEDKEIDEGMIEEDNNDKEKYIRIRKRKPQKNQYVNWN